MSSSFRLSASRSSSSVVKISMSFDTIGACEVLVALNGVEVGGVEGVVVVVCGGGMVADSGSCGA